MNKIESISVLLIGFSDYERKLFGSIAALTKRRARRYRLVDDLRDGADILVVNGDDQGALAIWRKLYAFAGETPSLLVSQSPMQEAGAVYLCRPLIFTRVVVALDQVAIQDLKVVPDLVIEHEEHLSCELENTFKRISGIDAKRPQHRALVVDDSPSVRKLMEIELRISGVGGDFAESAEEARQLLDRKTYDIVFLDVVLPDVDGYHICKSIKKNSVTRHTPVIMLTGKSSAFDRVRGKLAGCNSYLVKPVPHDALQAVFRRYLPVEKPKHDGHMLAAVGAG